MPDDETRCPSRNFLRTRAVEIIVSGIDKDTDGWEIDDDRSAAQ
jgi:hypothetical protein